MKTSYIVGGVVVVCVIGLFAARSFSSPASDAVAIKPLDVFAQCIADAGAQFYGAYWCPHCQEQKKIFNNSKKLPYIECSTPNGQAQLPVCLEKEIISFPTWIYANGDRFEGHQTLEELGEKTGCEVPQS